MGGEHAFILGRGEGLALVPGRVNEMAEAVFRASDLSHSIRIRVVGLNAMRVRWWLAAHLFRLGALVAGFSVEIEIRNESNGG